jgi:tRNA/tmRNA/rRNA uracil-C5-methylase (TrmA/RlmC/RlmD family)
MRAAREFYSAVADVRELILMSKMAGAVTSVPIHARSFFQANKGILQDLAVAGVYQGGTMTE